MAILLHADKFRETSKFVAAITAAFADGAETVDVVAGDNIVGTVLSREAAQKALARKVAEQWLAHPEIIDDLERSLNEKPEAWG